MKSPIADVNRACRLDWRFWIEDSDLRLRSGLAIASESFRNFDADMNRRRTHFRGRKQKRRTRRVRRHQAGAGRGADIIMSSSPKSEIHPRTGKSNQIKIKSKSKSKSNQIKSPIGNHQSSLNRQSQSSIANLNRQSEICKSSVANLQSAITQPLPPPSA